MGRRIASQVHKTASRLMRGNIIKEPPLWYNVVLEYPPLPLPPRSSPQRDPYDLPPPTKTSSLKPPRPETQPIVYLEDKIRKQFFRDHPFESFRAKTLVEGAHVRDEHPIRGEQWQRLSQRGRNPSPEDAIKFALNLHEAHGMPLSTAYQTAVGQFTALRSEHSVSTAFAALEAETYGAEFGPGEIERAYELEEQALESWEKREETDPGAIAARKRWRAILDKEEAAWTKGKDYVQRWKAGERPSYRPVSKESSVIPGQESLGPDFMGIRKMSQQ